MEMRGGERQTELLIKGLEQKGWQNYLACRIKSPLSRTDCLSKENIFPILMLGELDLIAGIRIGLIARKIGTRIIHCHTALAHSLGLIARTISKAKLVVTRRVDFPLSAPIASTLKYRRVDHIIAISRRIEAILLQAGVSREKVSLIPSGVELKDPPSTEAVEKLRAELDISLEDIVIGTVAALVGHKDYPTLLRAFNMVSQKIPRAHLLALGEGDDFPKIQKLVTELGITSKVKFLGFRKDVRDFFGLFRVYVQSSKMEGLCTSLIEAMFHRLPIAATSTGGIPDLIEHRISGLLSSPEDPEALASSIIELLNNPQLAQELGVGAYLKSLDFTVENMVNRTEKLYLKLLD
jgi:glycosyltransferase involved in cell wall biosynthesis